MILGEPVPTHADARCPACSQSLTGAIATDEAGVVVPTAGDVSVCLGCAALLQFNADLTVKLLWREDLEALEPDLRAELLQAQQLVLSMKK